MTLRGWIIGLKRLLVVMKSGFGCAGDALARFAAGFRL